MRKRHLFFFFLPILCFAWIQENDLRADVNLTQRGIEGEVRKLPLPLIPVTLTPEYPPGELTLLIAPHWSVKTLFAPTGAEKRTLSEMQRRRFQNVQEDEGEMKRDSIHDLLLRELTRGENTGKQLITFRLQQAHSFFLSMGDWYMFTLFSWLVSVSFSKLANNLTLRSKLNSRGNACYAG